MIDPQVSLTLSLADARDLTSVLEDALDNTLSDIDNYHPSENDINDLNYWKHYEGFLSRTLQDVTQRLDYSQGRTPPSTYLASSSQELINQALKQLDLRPCDLAEKLGVSRGQISKWKKHNEYMSVSRQTMIKELMQ